MYSNKLIWFDLIWYKGWGGGGVGYGGHGWVGWGAGMILVQCTGTIIAQRLGGILSHWAVWLALYISWTIYGFVLCIWIMLDIFFTKIMIIFDNYTNGIKFLIDIWKWKSNLILLNFFFKFWLWWLYKDNLDAFILKRTIMRALRYSFFRHTFQCPSRILGVLWYIFI